MTYKNGFVVLLSLLLVACATPVAPEERSYRESQLESPADCVILSNRVVCEITLPSGLTCVIFYSSTGVAIDCDWQ